MRKIFNKTKKGAASFYMVAFSTLILIVIVTSFAAVIISEVTRTANDDLSQSAYDSALAGVEDAKLAIYNYRNCLNNGAVATAPNSDGVLSCDEIVWYMENPDCDMVGHILGRIGSDEEGETIVEESSTAANNMAQAYTCVEVSMPTDYRSTLSSSNQTRVIKTKFENVEAKDVKQVKISWYSDQQKYNYTNFSTSGGVKFPSESEAAVAVPPTISISMLQTAPTFVQDDFTVTKGDRTDRGTLFLVPAGERVTNNGDNYLTAYKSDSGANRIDKNGFLKSNDKVSKNLPYAVYCPENSGTEFACSVTIDLPDPIGGDRNDDTFIFSVTLPYGSPSTDFAMEFMCGDGAVCSTETIETEDGGTEEVPTNVAALDGVQIKIDSTGRANDMYRRVETRLEPESDYPLSLTGPLVLLGDTNETLLDKNYTVTCEYDFSPTCSR